jgi:hypothetical protein
MSVVTTMTEPTVGTVWQAVAGGVIDDGLLEWPPDVFALTEVLLDRSAAYRFALSPPGDNQWPPARMPGWAGAVAAAGRRWSEWAEDRQGALPELLTEEWDVVRDAADTSITDLGGAHEWRTCEALLTLHAIADEACAGLGVALDSLDGGGFVYRARGRELLANTGSLARIPTHMLRVLPRLRTPPNGTSIRSLSRYASVQRPGVDVRWHKVLGRRPGTAPRDKGVNRLLLPWPLRVRESDFRPVPDSVDTASPDPQGFFEFAPSERLDLDLVDRMLVAAHDEVDQVNVVVLPESAVAEDEIDGLEAVLSQHGVIGLVTGVRQRADQTTRFGRNWVHIGASTGDYWVHIRQAKHHRWSLDQAQVDQYHLGGALHPRIRWWEAIEVPRQSVQIIETGEGSTVVSLVCEDLAQIDDVADVLRSVGPMVLIIPLLDGPQLSSRWAARYASVLADDPGSTVLTLTSYGMARRSRPHGQEASPVVALWKDPVRGVREIPLEHAAQGVLISANADRAIRRSSDGRRPVQNGSEFFDMSVYQVRASTSGSGRSNPRPGPPSQPVLEPKELTILTAWAEALAEAVAIGPERADAVSDHARAGAQWRAELGIADVSAQLDRAIGVIDDVVRAVQSAGALPTPDAILAALADRWPSEPRLERLANRVLRSAIEQRQARLAMCRKRPDSFPDDDLTERSRPR